MTTPFSMNMKHLLLVFALFLSGCDLLGSDEDSFSKAGTVLVANGGNFSDQNGYITSIDLSEGSVTHHADLGGFLQGVVSLDDTFFALVNTFSEGRVDVLNGDVLSLEQQFTPVLAPRYAAQSGGVLYVTNFVWEQPGFVTPITLATGEIGPSIQVGMTPEGIANVADKMIVANAGSLGSGSVLSVFLPGEIESRSVDIGCDGPRDLFVISDTELAVVCTGKTVYNDEWTQVLEQTMGEVVFFDARSESVTGRVSLSQQASSTNGTQTGYYSKDTKEVFITLSSSEEIVVVSTEQRSVSSVIQVPETDGLIGLSGIAYDAGRDQLIIGRFPTSSGGSFPDFTSAGTVQLMNRAGIVYDSYVAGASISSITLR
ncbi:MAG TPA: hypothetical protein DCY57_04795 [Bacteroidetes bacterium]|nr:hypothetical protein [Bacteroidota bacterium]